MKKIIVVGLGLMAPFIVFAQTWAFIVTTLKGIVNSAIVLIMIIAVAVFLWGIAKFITAAGDETKIKSARGYIIYGLIGIFVMVSFWGIIQVFGSTFGFTPGQGTITAPTIGVPNP